MKTFARALTSATLAVAAIVGLLATVPSTDPSPPVADLGAIEPVSSRWQTVDVDHLTGHEYGAKLWGSVTFQKVDRSWESDPRRAIVRVGASNTRPGQCIAARIWAKTHRMSWSPLTVGWSQKDGFSASTSVGVSMRYDSNGWTWACPTASTPYRRIFIGSTITADPKLGHGRLDLVAVEVYTWNGRGFSHRFYDVNEWGGA